MVPPYCDERVEGHDQWMGPGQRYRVPVLIQLRESLNSKVDKTSYQSLEAMENN